MKFVSIDIETTGLDRVTNDIIEFAAIIDDFNDPKPIDELPVFHAYIEKANRIYVGDPYALAMHAKIFEILAAPDKHQDKRFCSVNSLMYAFSNFLHEHKYPFDEEKQKFTVIPAGKNFGSFDRPFLESKVPKEHWHDIYFHHRVLDPAMLYFHPSLDEVLPDTQTCMNRSGIRWRPGEVQHTAVADAKVVIQLIRNYYETMKDFRYVPAND